MQAVLPIEHDSCKKSMTLGLLVIARLPDDRLWLRKTRSWEKTILCIWKHALSGRYNYRSWVDTDCLLVSGWPITLQLSLDSLASLCIRTRRHVLTPASRLLIGSAVSPWPAPTSFANFSRARRWMKWLKHGSNCEKVYAICRQR